MSTDDVRIVRLATLEALLDASVGFYALTTTYEHPNLALDEGVRLAIVAAIREAAYLVGRESEPRIAAIIYAQGHHTPENAQETPVDAKIAKKKPKTAKKA